MLRVQIDVIVITLVNFLQIIYNSFSDDSKMCLNWSFKLGLTVLRVQIDVIVITLVVFRCKII